MGLPPFMEIPIFPLLTIGFPLLAIGFPLLTIANSHLGLLRKASGSESLRAARFRARNSSVSLTEWWIQWFQQLGGIMAGPRMSPVPGCWGDLDTTWIAYGLWDTLKTSFNDGCWWGFIWTIFNQLLSSQLTLSHESNHHVYVIFCSFGNDQKSSNQLAPLVQPPDGDQPPAVAFVMNGLSNKWWEF